MENYSFGMKMSTRVIDYKLKGFIEERNPKISLSAYYKEEAGHGVSIC
jgi:hypothetical protein